MRLKQVARPDWLYTNGAESIRILTDTTGLMLLMCGPGTAQHAHTFDNPQTRDKFLHWFTDGLGHDGWSLAAADRRARSRAADPPMDERRRCPRDPFVL
jgi:hypothetical protein